MDLTNHQAYFNVVYKSNLTVLIIESDLLEMIVQKPNM